MSHHLPIRDTAGILYSPVYRGLCLDPAGYYTSLLSEQSDFFFSFLFLSHPFLYSWRHRIILPILEWLQQRHCYSQGAVSPCCNSIHSQLERPVIYRKSSSSEEPSLHIHTGNSLSTDHHVLGPRSGQFKAASGSVKWCTVVNPRPPYQRGCANASVTSVLF